MTRQKTSEKILKRSDFYKKTTIMKISMRRKKRTSKKIVSKIGSKPLGRLPGNLKRSPLLRVARLNRKRALFV